VEVARRIAIRADGLANFASSMVDLRHVLIDEFLLQTFDGFAEM